MSPPPLTFNAWLRYDLIRRSLEDLDVASVLEIGTGGGAMGARLAERYPYIGVEPDPDSFATAQARIEGTGLGRMVRDLSDLDAGATFDLVCAFEVLEHIEHDDVALTDWSGLIRPGGWLVLSVPANPDRYGPWDRRVGHYRRYDPLDMRTLLLTTGFEDPLIHMYGFPLGYVLEWSRNAIAGRSARDASMTERTAASGRSLQLPEGLGDLSRFATAPFRLLQRPFVNGRLGTGLVARARRRR